MIKQISFNTREIFLKKSDIKKSTTHQEPLHSDNFQNKKKKKEIRKLLEQI